MINILLIGGPGSGKGTLGKFLSKNVGVHLSMGELFRFHTENNTEIGKRVDEIISAGGLADDQTTIEVITYELEKLYGESDNAKNLTLVFDGFPRTIEQGPMLDDLLSKYNRSLDIVFFLDVPDNVLLERLQERSKIENRKGDEDLEYCRKRIEVYHTRTKILLDFYKKRGILCTIDGTKSIEEVQRISSDLITSNIYDNIRNSSYGPEQGHREG